MFISDRRLLMFFLNRGIKGQSLTDKTDSRSTITSRLTLQWIDVHTYIALVHESTGCMLQEAINSTNQNYSQYLRYPRNLSRY